MIKTIVNAIIGTLISLAVLVFALGPFVDSHPFQFPNSPVTLFVDAAEAAWNLMILIVGAVTSVLISAIRAVRMRILDVI